MHLPSLPIVIPPIYGLKGVEFETFTADGPISYWNAYVGVGQMGGRGNFSDPRIGLSITQTPDVVTSKLPALLAYQLSLRAPKAPKGTIDQAAASRGKQLFRNEAGCAACHQSPNFTDVLSGPDPSVPFLHHPVDTGMDPVAWAIEGERRGAGEILLTSIDRDGTRSGLDLEVTRQVAEAVSIPVIAGGGCGLASHFADGFSVGKADAVSAGTFFALQDQSPMQTRAHIRNRGIPIRLHS